MNSPNTWRDTVYTVQYSVQTIRLLTGHCFSEQSHRDAINVEVKDSGTRGSKSWRQPLQTQERIYWSMLEIHLMSFQRNVTVNLESIEKLFNLIFI